MLFEQTAQWHAKLSCNTSTEQDTCKGLNVSQLSQST